MESASLPVVRFATPSLQRGIKAHFYMLSRAEAGVNACLDETLDSVWMQAGRRDGKIALSRHKAWTIRSRLSEHAKDKFDTLLFFWKNGEQFQGVLHTLKPRIRQEFGLNSDAYANRDFVRLELRALTRDVLAGIARLEPLVVKADYQPHKNIKDIHTKFIGQTFGARYIETRLQGMDLSPDEILDAAKPEGPQSRIHVPDGIFKSATIIPFRVG
jgi:hypothetical protein